MLPNFLFFLAFDGEKRRGQVEIKLSLKSQLVNYPRCSYCESELIYENFHVDHIYPANRGELKVPEKAFLQLSPCSLIVIFIIDLIMANTLFTEDEASLRFNI